MKIPCRKRLEAKYSEKKRIGNIEIIHDKIQKKKMKTHIPKPPQNMVSI